MRNTQKWLVFLLCAVMLVSNLSITAAAAESAAPLDLQVVPAGDGMARVDILATEEQIVADGKLVLTYDPEVLTYAGTESGSAWTNADDVTLSVNAAEGRIILAFANAAAANSGELFSIRFSGFVRDASLGLQGPGSYISGTSLVPAIGGEYCPSDNFVDIRNAAPIIHEAVDYMVGSGYMNGMSQTMFGPHVDLNRAMMVTILYRIAGEPEVQGVPAFTDVPADVFYTAPVVWAVENGITNGISASLFAPDKSLTRQELVTFLHRFAKHMGYDVTATTDLSAYTDLAEVQPYALEAFQWAVASGIVKGTTDTTLAPEDTTTRAQVSLMVYRMLSAQDE